MDKKINKLLEKDYRGVLRALLQHEINNGAELVTGYTVESAVDDFMNSSNFTTLFDLKHYLK